MLNLICAICSEMYTASDDVHATICGHMFHVNCLSQWFQRSKTCPQCRSNCSDRSVIRLYFNNSNLDYIRVDVASLQEQLNSAQEQLNSVQVQLIARKNELQKVEDEIKKSKEAQEEYMKPLADLKQDLSSAYSCIHNYAAKTRRLESQLKYMDDVLKENKDLREENEANERKLKSSNSREDKMINLVANLNFDLRKEIALKKSQEDKISQLESENYQLLQKVRCTSNFQNYLIQTKGGHMKNNHNNNINNFEIPRRKSLD